MRMAESEGIGGSVGRKGKRDRREKEGRGREEGESMGPQRKKERQGGELIVETVFSDKVYQGYSCQASLPH